MKTRVGRKKTGGRFARLPLMVLETLAVTTLNHAAFRVLVLLAAQYNGHNNGAIGLTANQASEAGISSDRTLYRSLRELQERQLIDETYPASRVPPRPTMWALTWMPLDNTAYSNETKRPTHAYKDWRPGRSAA
jgi:hypothetical protein